MFNQQIVKDNFSDASSDYDANAHLQRVVRGHATTLARQLWPKGSNVLDLGCGTAEFAKENSKQNWQVTQADIAPGMCNIAKHYAPTINASADNLPFADNKFDGVFSSLMLQWCDEPVLVFEQIQRILKSGGHVVLSTLLDGTLCELSDAFSQVDNYPHTSSFSAAHTILAQAEQTGLTLKNASQKRLVEHYPDSIALMRGLQIIGANNKHNKRKRGLMTPRQFAKLEQYYRKTYLTEKGLPASWQVLFLVLKKE